VGILRLSGRSLRAGLACPRPSTVEQIRRRLEQGCVCRGWHPRWDLPRGRRLCLLGGHPPKQREAGTGLALSAPAVGLSRLHQDSMQARKQATTIPSCPKTGKAIGIAGGCLHALQGGKQPGIQRQGGGSAVIQCGGLQLGPGRWPGCCSRARRRVAAVIRRPAVSPGRSIAHRRPGSHRG